MNKRILPFSFTDKPTLVNEFMIREQKRATIEAGRHNNAFI